MYVLHVCSELFPLLKTGGLADVVGAMPAAQIAQGANVRVLLPGFPALKEGIPETHEVATLDTFAGRVTLRFGHYQGVGIYLIDAPHLYDRPGSPYHDQAMYAYSDNNRRFGLLGWVAAELASGCDHFWRPQVVHAHDWHAGLACAYLAARGRPARSVFTVHNLAYQGLFSAHHMAELYLPQDFFQIYGLEFYGQISFLKAGLFYADHVTTVSPTYAKKSPALNSPMAWKGYYSSLNAKAGLAAFSTALMMLFGIPRPINSSPTAISGKISKRRR